MVWDLRFPPSWCWGFMSSGLLHYITELLIPDILKELVRPLLSVRAQKTWVFNHHGVISQIWLVINAAMRISNYARHISVVRILIWSKVWEKLFKNKLDFTVLIMNTISWSWSALMTTMNFSITLQVSELSCLLICLPVSSLYSFSYCFALWSAWLSPHCTVFCLILLFDLSGCHYTVFVTLLVVTSLFVCMFR
jgi:hypothetical protein